MLSDSQLIGCYVSRGKVYHVSLRNKETADELWEEYQKEAVSAKAPFFERRPLKAVSRSSTSSFCSADDMQATSEFAIEALLTIPVKGALLAQHFAINSGAEYKYNVATSSLPFDRSPACVLRALDQWVGFANDAAAC